MPNTALKGCLHLCPVVSYDENLLFFTRSADPDCNKTLIIDGVNLNIVASKKEYNESLRMVYSQIASEYIAEPLSSGFNQDIWYTRLNRGQPYGIFHPSYPINDVLPNSICSNFGTSNSFLIINQFFPEGGIENGFSVSEFDGVSFTFPRPLHIAGFIRNQSYSRQRLNYPHTCYERWQHQEYGFICSFPNVGWQIYYSCSSGSIYQF